MMAIHAGQFRLGIVVAVVFLVTVIGMIIATELVLQAHPFMQIRGGSSLAEICNGTSGICV
jgi:hypothetical protein